jgi:hypothetical protein
MLRHLPYLPSWRLKNSISSMTGIALCITSLLPFLTSSSSTELKPLRHEPLDQEKNEVRLITSVPSIYKKGEICLQYQMRKFSLDSCPNFRALSYTWGSPGNLRTIIINGAQLKVRRNLYKFLLRLNDADDREIFIRWYWIDQISIDQENILERNHQVGLMQEIYSKAQTVHAWLGEDTGGDSAVLECIVRGRTNNWATFPMDSLAQASAKQRFLIYKTAALCKRPYWNRLWIVQELWLAAKVVLWCGPFRLDADWLYGDSILYSWAFAEEDRKSVYSVRNLLEQSIGTSHDALKKRQYQNGGMEEKPEGMTLSEAITRFSHHDCEDIRDKLYGLQSLVRPQQRLQIDYSASVESIVEEALTMLIRNAIIPEVLSISRTTLHIWLNTQQDAMGVQVLTRELLGGLSYNAERLSSGIRSLAWARCAAYLARKLPANPSLSTRGTWAAAWSVMTTNAVTPKQKELSLAFEWEAETFEKGISISLRDRELKEQATPDELGSSRIEKWIADVCTPCGFEEHDGFLVHPEDEPFQWSS